MTLSKVAFKPGFMTNIVSLSELIKRGEHWSAKEGHLARNGPSIAAVVARTGGHWVMGRNSESESDVLSYDDHGE
jgi:hypothetical protein